MMKRLTIVAAFTLLISPALAAGATEEANPADEPQVDTSKIYRTTDERGRPVFSDQGSEGASEVEVKKPMTFPAGKFANEYRQFNRTDEAPPPEATFSYSKLQVTSPANDTAIRSNNGDIEITFETVPSIGGPNRFQVTMDGKVIAEPHDATPIALENVDRGTHQVRLEVVDPKSGKVLQSSDTVSFTILRHSVLNKSPK
ncbi:MAG: hypothetical protein KDI19_13840 [Pseudomonadales bacterium]|nr:hypothetical protein [Pseudomonadales bacterium]